MKTVGITGGAGFIGSYITKKFLEENYRVKVSVTNISSTNKYQHLFNLKKVENLSVRGLNVENMDFLKEFIKDCEILIHCGTPFQLEVDHPEKDMFEPTIKGTGNFLQAIKEEMNVRKVVFVASVASYNTSFPLPVPGQNHDHVYSENDEPYYNKEDNIYAQAKYFANQAVRKFIKENPDLNVEIVSVAPVGVIGNPLSDRQDSTSVGIQLLFKAMLAPNPFIQMMYDNDIEFAMVDVEDVAEGIYAAAVKSGNHGKNYLLTSESWRVSDISRILNGIPPKCKPRKVYSNDLAQKELGLNFKPAEVPLKRFSNSMKI